MNNRFSLNHESAHEPGCTMKDPTIKCRKHVMESNRKMPRSPQESSQPYMIAVELKYNIHTSVQIPSNGQ